MHDVKHTLKTTGAVICCLLCVAVIVLFAYFAVNKTELSADVELYHADNAILNGFIYYLANGLNANPFLVITGLIALLFEILFSKPLTFLFRQLPLGRILESEKPMTMKARLIPALLIGVAAAVDISYAEVSPDSFAETAEVLNWIFLAVIGLAFVAQLVILLSQGGIWRALVSGGLLFAADVGIGALFGVLATLLAVMFVALSMVFAVILAGIVIFSILAIASD